MPTVYFHFKVATAAVSSAAAPMARLLDAAALQDKAALRDNVRWATVPVYLNSQRKACLFSVRLESPKDVDAAVWDERGVAITLWQSHL
jgi:hypothetical protein